MYMTKTVYGVYGKDAEASGLILVFQTSDKANQVKNELNAWASESPIPIKDGTQWSDLSYDRDQRESFSAAMDAWELRSPIHHLNQDTSAWMYEEFFVRPIVVYDEPVVPGLMRVRAARRVAKNWRLWKRLQRLSKLAHQLSLVPDSVESDFQRSCE